MLSPDQLESAGDRVAAIYNDIEARMLDHLVNALIDGDITQRTLTEINLLAQTHTEQLRAILLAERDNISDAVYETVERLLQASDNDDMARTGSDTEKWPQQVEATVIGIQLILNRDNIQMVEGAKQAFLDASIAAITSVNTGVETTEKALHRAVRNLEGEGIPIITYQNAKTGRVTVRNSVDVAVRRHIRSQISQDSIRITLERIEEDDVDLVEVSSHPDARPSHAEWQGRCYSVKGEVIIDGIKYPDFWSSCMLGDIGDILGGVNCRHSVGPYVHGTPLAYEPNPKHPSGVDGAEIYQMEQKQRYHERQIRAAKRELKGAQIAYDRDKTNIAAKTELLKAQERLEKRQEAMRKHIEKSNAKSKNGISILHRKYNREWAGDMPKSARVSASGRNLRQFIQDPKVKKQLKDAGITQKAFRAGVTAEMAKRGGTSADFASLSAKDQQDTTRKVIERIAAIPPKKKKSERSIPVGGVFGESQAAIKIANMDSRLIPQSEIEEKAIIAGKGTSTDYRKKKKLAEQYGGSADDWFHSVGEAWVFDPADGKIRKGEFHWAEEPSVGIYEFRFKGWVPKNES